MDVKRHVCLLYLRQSTDLFREFEVGVLRSERSVLPVGFIDEEDAGGIMRQTKTTQTMASMMVICRCCRTFSAACPDMYLLRDLESGGGKKKNEHHVHQAVYR